MKTPTSAILTLIAGLVLAAPAGWLGDAHAAKAKPKAARKAPAKKAPPKKGAPAPVLDVSGEAASAGSDMSAFTIDPGVSTVTLRMSHSITGRFDTTGMSALNGKIEISPAGKITARRLEFKPDSFTSLISLRDDHIKSNYLETSKHPTVALENVSCDLGRYEPDIQGEGGGKGGKPPVDKPFTGELVVKGARVPVSGTAKVYLENEILKGHAEFNTKVSAYPIKTPRYMGVGVLDEFTILVDFLARPDIADDEIIGGEDL